MQATYSCQHVNIYNDYIEINLSNEFFQTKNIQHFILKLYSCQFNFFDVYLTVCKISYFFNFYSK
jgi:hypothetical protein